MNFCKQKIETCCCIQFSFDFSQNMIVGILDFLITPYSDLVFWTEEKIQEWWKKLQVLDIYLIDIYLIFLFDIVKKFKRLIGNSIFKSIN